MAELDHGSAGAGSGSTGLLVGRRAIVTGGANPRGIGQAIVALFLAHGARVASLDVEWPLNDVTPSRSGELPEEGRFIGAEALKLHCDVSDDESCRKAVAKAERVLGGIDILVNNAGIVAATRIEALETAEFERMVDVNLMGTYRMTSAALSALKKSGQGASIVNLGSTAALRGGGLLGGSHYAASKGGIISFTKGLARELGVDGIRANCVAPGIIETDMTIGKFGADWEAGLKAAVPLQRFGTPGEVAKAILFLASDLASYTTGAVVDVNGGFHIH